MFEALANIILHLKQQAKVGLAVSVEAAGEDFMAQQEGAAAQAASSPPF